MMYTEEPAQGCTIMVCFDHMLGDAKTCLQVVKTWSDNHKQITGSTGEVPPQMKLPLTAAFNVTSGCIRRRFYFQMQEFAPIKRFINSEQGKDKVVHSVKFSWSCEEGDWGPQKVGWGGVGWGQ